MIIEYLQSLTFHDIVIIITAIAAICLAILIHREGMYLKKVEKTAKFYLDVKDKVAELEAEKNRM